MSVVGSQANTFLALLQMLRPHWRRDSNLPRRIQSLLASGRAFGSRDRRLYRELIYTTLRYLAWIEPWLDRDPQVAIQRVAWLANETRATAAFRAELRGDLPDAVTVDARAAVLGEAPDRLLPDWFRDHCPEVFVSPELDTQLSRAPVWLRLQHPDRAADVVAEFAARGWRAEPAPALSSAWRLIDDADVTSTDAFQSGAVEVQDLGSQLLLASVRVDSGTWLDACAGAGGKTLQLAQLLGGAGVIDAHDIRPAALEELQRRARRAGVSNVRVVSRPGGPYAGVLVDAPCSGSGTWRRAPHLKWTTTPAMVAQKAELQLQLLARFARFVQSGGQLVYATCSLSRSENEQVIAAFLATHPDFQIRPLAATFGFQLREGGLTVWPSRHDTDGFFVASFARA